MIDQCGNSLPTESMLDSGIVWELAGRRVGALKPLEDGCGCSWGWTERKVGDGEQPYFELLFARTLNRQKFRSDLKSYCFCSSVIPVTLLNIRLLCSFQSLPEAHLIASNGEGGSPEHLGRSSCAVL